MRKTAAGFLLLLALVAELAFAQAVPIASSKHNLSATTTNTIRAAAGGTTEICVFCHTPHGSPVVPQLWNRALSAASYTLYSSDYLTGLGYPTAVLGSGQSSRLCLSCHDGTMALGSVYNTAGSGTTGAIAMAGGVTTLPAGAANLGINLSDDHPVGYLYQPGSGAGQDPELVTRTFPWPKGVQLDPNTAAGRVECKSCHDPHNNQFTKFLRMQISDGSPAGAAYLCKHCHNKTNYDLSSHATSIQPYTPASGAAATTVGKNSCLNCHKPHTALGKPLLRGAEEVTCYNAGCHGTNNPIIGNTTADSGTTRRNIQAEMGKARAHPTNDISDLHKDLPFVAGTGAETPAQLGSTNRHAECYDCHNPHQVQPAQTVEKSTRGNLRVSRALTGMWGVQPSWPAPPTGMATNAVTFVADVSITYTVLAGSAVTDEYQVCMKCHSNYVTLPFGARNLAKEINPLNSSYHGIVPFLADGVTRATTNYFVNSTTMVAPWAGTGTFDTAQSETCRLNPTANAQCTTLASTRGRVWCSDCHGSDLATMPPVAGTKTAPYGPHGSNNTGTAWGASNSDRMLVRSIASAVETATPLCVGCHRGGSYASGNTGSRMNRHGARTVYLTNGCFTCHMWEAGNVVTGASGDIFPHGMNKRWATIGKTATAGSGQMVDAFVGGSAQANINYATKTCWTAATIGTAADGSGGVTCARNTGY